jgi:hypothetical protein
MNGFDMTTHNPDAPKHVLIVSPRFPPINAPDHQRIRMALPYLLEEGWGVTVLCVAPEFVEAGQDDHLRLTVPNEVRTVRTKALSQKKTRALGFGGLTWRSKKHLKNAGDKLLANERFDLVYFSTTEFGVIPLGIDWKQRFEIPFVVDIQDPWVNDYYRINGVRPPGGILKHGLTQWIAKYQEPRTLGQAAHITVVSPGYKQNLLSKYSFLTDGQITVLPFGGPELDFAALNRLPAPSLKPPEPMKEWYYVGRAGPDMQFSLTAFFRSLRRALDDNIIDGRHLNVRFVGTDYAPKGMNRKTVESLADSEGLAGIVHEDPQRIPYFETLQRLKTADALIVPGSNDPNYTASKIYPYILANRPMLTVFHCRSSVNRVLRETNAGTAITFDENVTSEALSDEIYQHWFATRNFDRVPTTDWNQFQPYTAKAMTGRLIDVFNSALKHNNQ